MISIEFVCRLLCSLDCIHSATHNIVASWSLWFQAVQRFAELALLLTVLNEDVIAATGVCAGDS